MDNALTQLFSWQFILFSLGVFVVTWVVRTIVEFIFPKADGNRFWEKLCLPLMPVVTGSLIGYFATTYAYPAGLATTSGRLLLGSVAGLFSSSIYQVAKGMLKDKIAAYVSSSQPNSPQLSQVIPFPTK